MSREHVLSAENGDQLAEYLRFLRRKRDTAIAEVAAEFKDVKETRLLDDFMEVGAVEDTLDSLLQVVRGSMRRDIQSAMFSSVLLLKQVLEQAEQSKAAVSIDIASTEDISLLRAVEDWDHDVHGSSGSAPPLKARAAVARASPSRALPVVGQTQDPKLLAELQNAHDDNSTLQERFQSLQVKCTDILREKTRMQEQIESMSQGSSEEIHVLRSQIEELQAELAEAHHSGQQSGAGAETLLRELHESQDANAQLAAALDEARAEQTQRIERSAQFTNMRQMLAKKNAVVRQMRDTLAANGIHVDDVDATED